MQDSSEKLIEYLCSLIECRDFTAVHHCEQIRRLTEIMLEKIMQFCPEYKLTQEECNRISFAASLHDIGKISVSDRVLQKPCRLSPDESEVMKNHTRKGKQIFDQVMKNLDKDSPDYEVLQCCGDVCLSHHERFDGGGYPEGLKGNDIPISAQVVGLMDAYDALVNERIYKVAYDKNEAFEMIVEGECGVFNPRLIEIFRMVRMELEEVLEETK